MRRAGEWRHNDGSYHTVPWDSMRKEREQGRMSLRISKDEIETASGLTAKGIKDLLGQ